MGKLYLNNIQLFIFMITLVSGVMFSHIAHALPPGNQSGSCTIQNTFPNGFLYPPSHFGASRSSGARWHAGVDFFYPKGTKVDIPAGCEIRLYSDGTVIWKSDPTGYGQYMFIDCKPGGVPVTLRYAHIARYVTSTKQIEQGRTGIETASIPDMYHFEVLISQTAGKGTPVDPECVLGMTSKTGAGPQSPIAECRKCPAPIIEGSPVDFCNDNGAVAALINHSKKCYKGNDKNNPGGETVDPNQLTGVANQGDPGTTTGPSDGEADPNSIYDNDHVYTDPGDDDGYTGDSDILYPPSPPDPPIEPPTPDDPGTPGGDPNLTPPPAPGAEPEKMTGCAADTWTAMVNQAVMETRREDILNKRFIVKPDSVIDYSCFDLHVKKVADDAGPIFSETKKWANLPVDLIGKVVTVKRELGSKSLDGAIMDIVQSVATNYRRRQFNQPLLSGATPVPASAGSSNCDVMAKVWKAAKCKNFDGASVFYTFDDLKTAEPREYPPNMSCN